MILRLNDHGVPVKGLQRNLNKLGSILLVDGDFGPATRDAVLDARVPLNLPGNGDADDELQAAVAAVKDPFPRVTSAGATFIARLGTVCGIVSSRKQKPPSWEKARQPTALYHAEAFVCLPKSAPS
ncbi:MAG: hypothetical protein AUH72_21060 [Acidobacteria bacterium 13_1_40CM_4_65_8]|nr:MAG: hypothetical protein AUH72_21060 [Acidobacteria bacterium 13_1_40CM_4_65_8]